MTPNLVMFGWVEEVAKGADWLDYRDFRHRREEVGRNAPPALFFDWGFWGVLTKNSIFVQ